MKKVLLVSFLLLLSAAPYAEEDQEKNWDTVSELMRIFNSKYMTYNHDNKLDPNFPQIWYGDSSRNAIAFTLEKNSCVSCDAAFFGASAKERGVSMVLEVENRCAKGGVYREITFADFKSDGVSFRVLRPQGEQGTFVFEDAHGSMSQQSCLTTTAGLPLGMINALMLIQP